MRVLFISEGFDEKSIIAQPWRYTYETANQLAIRQHEVAVVTDSPCTGTCKESTVRDLAAYILPKTRLPPLFSQRMAPRHVKDVIKEFSPDVIHWDGGALIGSYIRRLKDVNIPVLVHISTNIYSFEDMHLPIQEYRSLEYTFLFYLFTMNSPLARPLISLLNGERIKLITVPNLAIKRKLMENGLLESKIKVIPTPLNIEELSVRARSSVEMRKKIGLDIDDFVVTYFGPSATYRGTDTLLYAVAKIRRNLPRLKLLMLLRQRPERENTVENQLRKLTAKLKLDNSVKFQSGVLEREKLIRFIQTSNAIALPFKFLFNEPPLSVLETMALGKPMITTRVSGLPELAGNDRGILVNPGDSNELSKAIYHIAKKPEEAKTLGRNAKEYVSRLPDWSTHTEYLLAMIERI